MQQEMEYIYQVYLEKNFTKAAEKLFISQPALSMAVHKVEDQMGTPLFDRTSRPLTLTAAGEAYLQYIHDTQQRELELRQQMQDILDGSVGTLRIGGSHYLNAYILPPVIAGFMREHPRIRLEMVESSSAQISRMLLEKKIDLTFNCNPEFMLDFERFPAFTDTVLLAVPKTLDMGADICCRALSAADVMAGRHLAQDCPTVPLCAFRTAEFLLLNPGNNLHDRALQLFAEADCEPRVKMQLSQLVTAYHLADAAVGLTFVSDRLVNTQGAHLHYYKLDSRLTTRQFYILLPKRRYISRAVRAFVRYVSDRV